MGPGALSAVLAGLTLPSHPNLLVGLDRSDDAAVYQINAEQALVQTVDFFPPVVDDPYTFGAIAAANALSDIYAMGARPILALAIAAFPDDLPGAILQAILQGGADKVAESGAVVAGGHTVVDNEPKYGLCVTGMIDPRRVLAKANAQVGDVLLLTKPLGTGILTTALKRDAMIESGMGDAVRSMTTLNAGAARAALQVGVSAATDVTGFGLLRHLHNMLAASRVAAELAFEALPILPHALNLAARGIVPGGTQRNLEAAVDVSWADDLAPHERLLCVDAQTSGGLLLAVPRENEAALLDALRQAETPAASLIGRLVAGPPGHIRVSRRA
jgi:selenide,water dikinase